MPGCSFALAKHSHRLVKRQPTIFTRPDSRPSAAKIRPQRIRDPLGINGGPRGWRIFENLRISFRRKNTEFIAENKESGERVTRRAGEKGGKTRKGSVEIEETQKNTGARWLMSRPVGVLSFRSAWTPNESFSPLLACPFGRESNPPREW